MDRVKMWIFYLRDFLVRNFMVESKAIINKNQITYFNQINFVFYLLIRILPFSLVRTIFGLFNLGVIYKLDSIYNVTNNVYNHILPIILGCQFIGIENSKEIIDDMSSKIKYYNANIPLNFIIKENNLEKFKKIKLKYLNKGKLVEKSIDINDFKVYPIYKLFEN